MVGVLRYGVLPLRLRALDLSERGTLAQVSVTGVGGLWTVREWRVSVAGSDRTMPISRVVLGLSALLTVAACSGRVSPVEPVVATGVERQDPGEPRLGEHAGFTLPELAVPEPVIPEPVIPELVIPELAEPPAAARASPVAGESPSGGRVSAEPPPVVAESSDRPREAGSEEPCHPAYLPCLPDLPGNALDCTDLRNDLKPVVVLDLADDPYRLAEGGSRRACVPPAGAAGGAVDPVGATVVGIDQGDPSEGGLLAPSWTPDPEPPDVENVAAVCGPISESPAPEAASEVLQAPEGDSPEPPPGRPPPGGGPSDELPLESPPAESGPTEPPESGEAPEQSQSPPTSDVSAAAGAATGDEWCLPEADDDTVRLFWCENDPAGSPDLEVYDSGGLEPTYRTRPLELRVGSRIERYSRCTGLNAVEEVVGFVELTETAVEEPLVGVQLCGRFFLGEDLYSWGLGLHRAWQDPDGRYRIEMPNPVEYLATC